MAKDTKETVETVSAFVNSYSNNNKEFCELFQNEHRTLQQSFTKLCLTWLETVAGEDYLTDGRNEASKKVAQELLKGEEPSKRLPLI